MGAARTHVVSQGSQSLLLYQPSGHSVLGQKMCFKIECNSVSTNWAVIMYVDGGNFSHGGDSFCSLRSSWCAFMASIYYNFGGKKTNIFMHQCPTSVSGERAKHGVWGSESTRQVMDP